MTAQNGALQAPLKERTCPSRQGTQILSLGVEVVGIGLGLRIGSECSSLLLQSPTLRGEGILVHVAMFSVTIHQPRDRHCEESPLRLTSETLSLLLFQTCVPPECPEMMSCPCYGFPNLNDVRLFLVVETTNMLPPFVTGQLLHGTKPRDHRKSKTRGFRDIGPCHSSLCLPCECIPVIHNRAPERKSERELKLVC